MSGILIRQDNGTWIEPSETGYGLESELQEILASHPELIPGVSAGAMTCREFQSDVGPADIVVVDWTGDLTLVECKLASNPQIRREVVGQVFDYASRLWKMDIEDFMAKWRMHASDTFDLEDENGESPLKASLARNLAEGRFRIVLAVDAINPALKRMIEYLNVMAGPGTSVIAVEYSRLRQGSVEILMPHVYGQELAEAKVVPGSKDVTTWDRETYRNWLQHHDVKALENFDCFLATALDAGFSFQASTSSQPAGSLPIFDSSGPRLGTVSFFYFAGQGTSVEFNLIRLSKLAGDVWPDAAVCEDFLEQLGRIPPLRAVAANLRASRFASRKPNVPLTAFSVDDIEKAVHALGTLIGGRTDGRAEQG